MTAGSNGTSNFSSLFCLWVVICFIVGSIYKGNLMSKLIAPKVYIPFKTFEELVDNRVMPFYIYNGSGIMDAAIVSAG